MMNMLKTLGDVIITEEPYTTESVTGSGAVVLFGIAAVLVVAAVALIIVNVVWKMKE